MNKRYPVRLLLALFLALSALTARAETISQVTSLGSDTYAVTATATHKFTRNTDKLKAAGIEAATQFCAKEGKQFQLVSAEENKSMYLVGAMAATTITFKALPPGAPAAVASATVAPALAPAAPPASPEVDQFSADMLKLDDLHKRGILTDEEYASAKKKVLDRLK